MVLPTDDCSSAEQPAIRLWPRLKASSSRAWIAWSHGARSVGVKRVPRAIAGLLFGKQIGIVVLTTRSSGDSGMHLSIASTDPFLTDFRKSCRADPINTGEVQVPRMQETVSTEGRACDLLPNR